MVVQTNKVVLPMLPSTLDDGSPKHICYALDHEMLPGRHKVYTYSRITTAKCHTKNEYVVEALFALRVWLWFR